MWRLGKELLLCLVSFQAIMLSFTGLFVLAAFLIDYSLSQVNKGEKFRVFLFVTWFSHSAKNESMR